MQDRRAFLKMAGAAMGVALFSRTVLGMAQEKRRPNVLLIFTDDQGSIDVNCYGAKDLITSNLDALAKKGTRFTQFYVGAPVCSPSRAALLTGRCPQRAQLAGNASSRPGHAGMPTAQVTIAEMLKTEGYATGHVGKWHLGFTPETMPNGQGFDYSFGHMGGCIDNYSHYFYWNGPNRHDLYRNGEEVWHDGQYFGELMVEECKGFIRRNHGRPFFLYWAINMPHYPMQATEKWRKRYAHLDQPRRRYAAFVSTADEMIGEVIEYLEKLRLREDTIIVWLSDHGHSTEERAFGGGGNAGKLRGHKFTVWEGGIRVPCIVSWPGRVPEGAVRGQVASSMDWMPTIGEYCGAPLPGRKLDGESIVRLIADEQAASPHEVLHWQLGDQWAVREGDWKLVHNGWASEENGRKTGNIETFLANLAEDVTERRNYADAHPQIVQRLTKLHEQWTREVERQ